VFTVTQTNVANPYHVPFVITDACGSVNKFVGGGKDSLAN
jgi:hypothetical protein